MAKKRSLAPFAFLVVLFAAVWMYFTPYLAMRKLEAAAEAGDTRALNDLVDFPALRESVKSELRSTVSRRIASDEGNPLAALGGLIAGKLASPFVDAAVTPQGIAALTEGRRPGEESDEKGDGEKRGVRAPDVKVKQGYEGLDRFVVRFHDRESGKERVALVMEREGLAGWKLTGVRLDGGDEGEK